MSLVLATILAVAGVLLTLVMLAAVTPLLVELRLEKDTATRFSASVRPFAGFGPRVRLRKRAVRDDAADEKKPTSKKKGRFSPRSSGQLGRAVLQLILDVLRRIRLWSAKIELKFGTGDPGETGQIYGGLMPLLHGLSAAPRTHIDLHPVFDCALLEGQAVLTFALTPARLVAPMLRFGWILYGARR